jgi:hypothetical protein
MTRSSLDRDSFQSLLACAFTVQRTLLDAHSSSSILELKHLIVTGQLDLKMTMRVIAGCARNVANATGVAIGLLESNQLAYIAGSGCAAACIGRRVSATLSVATNTRHKVEILRVENAETETRIEGAICRQFGAKSLLILPIYRDQALAGVIEIIFDEARVFDDREVCTYHSMANAAGEALAYSGTFERRVGKSTMLTRPPEKMKQRPLHDESLPGNISSLPNVHFSCPAREAGTEPEKLVSGQASSTRTDSSLKELTKPSTSRLLWWRLADSAAVIIVLVSAGWIAYGSGRSASSLTNSVPPTQDAHQHLEQLLSTRSEVINKSRKQSERIPTERVMKAGKRTPHRAVIGDQEIDYVSEDVTVRHLIPNLAVKPPKKTAPNSAR